MGYGVEQILDHVNALCGSLDPVDRKVLGPLFDSVRDGTLPEEPILRTCLAAARDVQSGAVVRNAAKVCNLLLSIVASGDRGNLEAAHGILQAFDPNPMERTSLGM